MKTTDKNIEKIEIQEKEILLARLKDHTSCLICKPCNISMIGFTINIISYREFLLNGVDKQLENIGFTLIYKEIDDENNLIISSNSATKNLDVLIHTTKTATSLKPSWSAIERANTLTK